MKSDVKGIITAVLTPRAEDGNVDVERIAPLVDFLFSKQVDGLFVCGSTGQGVSLSLQERKTVAEAMTSATSGRGTIMIHVGAIATREVLDLARHAGQIGAQAVSCLPPFYYPVGPDEIRDHYRRVADAAGVPVFIYNLPGVTNVPISPELAAELAADGSVCGIKIPNAYMLLLHQMAQIQDGRFSVFTGETHLLAGLSNGITVGTIGSMSNWIPELFVGLLRNFQAGNLARAAELQRLACKIFSTYVTHEHPSTRVLAETRGLTVGQPWLPMLPLAGDQEQTLLKKIQAFDLDYGALMS